MNKIKPIKVAAAVLMLAVGVSILAYAMSASEAAQRDFICYWAAGQRLVHHSDPYDGQGILQIEKSIGYKASSPFFMSEPPTAFFLVLPLGFLSGKAGAVLWSLAIIACLMASIRLLWILNGRPPDRLHLVGYLFPPGLHPASGPYRHLRSLRSGPIPVLPRFETVPRRRCADRSSLETSTVFSVRLGPGPLGCGLQAVPNSYRRTHRNSALHYPLLGIDHSAWSHYAQMRAEQIDDQIAPTTSLVFQALLAQNHPWVQFIPTAVACAWAVRRYLNNHVRWDWQNDIPLLLLVSVMTSPDAWFTDEAIVLPAILFMALSNLQCRPVPHSILLCRWRRPY